MRLRREMDSSRRIALLAAPLAVPLSMLGLYPLLKWLLGARRGYNLGFALYWAGWCFAFPRWVVGAGNLGRLFRRGRRPTTVDLAVLALPAAGAVATELIPSAHEADPLAALVSVSAAVVNATGEEVLWRGLYLEAFPDDPWLGAIYPLLGFTLWHLAPQTILPSRRGRLGFLLGAGVVGACSTWGAWRTGSIRATLIPHIVTDACGIHAARYRLGR
jgi:hypothetical protein